jgi:hypothetical protein
MTFADTLKTTLAGAKAQPALKNSLAKAGLGLLGLAALPLFAGGALGPTVKMLLTLGAVCGLAFVTLRLLARRASSSAAAQELRVVARASLSTKNSVALLEADGRRYLVAFGDGFATLLSNTTPNTESSGEPR